MATAAGDIALGWLDREESRESVDVSALVSAHAALLYRVAFSVVRQAAEAEDVVQETFLRVLERRERLPEIRDARAWLVRIAWNLAIDRKRGPVAAQIDDVFAATLAAQGPGADQQVADAAELEAVILALDRMPRLERSALLLSAIDELSVREIAAVLGKSESAVRALTFRARTRLQERLGKGGRR